MVKAKMVVAPVVLYESVGEGTYHNTVLSHVTCAGATRQRVGLTSSD